MAQNHAQPLAKNLTDLVTAAEALRDGGYAGEHAATAAEWAAALKANEQACGRLQDLIQCGIDVRPLLAAVLHYKVTPSVFSDRFEEFTTGSIDLESCEPRTLEELEAILAATELLARAGLSPAINLPVSALYEIRDNLKAAAAATDSGPQDVWVPDGDGNLKKIKFQAEEVVAIAKEGTVRSDGDLRDERDEAGRKKPGSKGQPELSVLTLLIAGSLRHQKQDFLMADLGEFMVHVAGITSKGTGSRSDSVRAYEHRFGRALDNAAILRRAHVLAPYLGITLSLD